MITHLYVLRHGTAVQHGTPGVPESERPLTPEGEKEVAGVAEAFDRLGLDPERVYTSPLPRARRTAEIVARELGLEEKLEVADVLSAGSSPRAIRDWLAGRKEDRVLIVGHNPDFTDLVGLLTGMPSVEELPFDLKKGGCAALRAKAGGGYELRWLVTPKLLRKLVD